MCSSSQWRFRFMYLLFLVLVYSSSVIEQNFPAHFFILIVSFTLLFSWEKNVTTRFLTCRSVSGNLYPLAGNACLICLAIAIVLKETLSTAASFATILSESSTGLKKLSILLLPVELNAKEGTCAFVLFALIWILCFKCKWFLISC